MQFFHVNDAIINMLLNDVSANVQLALTKAVGRLHNICGTIVYTTVNV